MKRITGIYLGAGHSRRMGAAKLSLACEGGAGLGSIALAEALHSKLQTVVAVVPPGPSPDWLPEDSCRGKLDVTVCRESGNGMSESLCCGLERARELGCDAVLVMLADQPFVTAVLINRLIDLWQAGSALDYAALEEAGSPRPPVLLAATMFRALSELQGDAGARQLLQGGRFRGVLIPPPEPRMLMDIDTPEDWARARPLL